MNLYAYVHNDPINMADPTGKNAIAEGLFFGGVTFVVGGIYYSTCNESNPSCAAARDIGDRIKDSLSNVFNESSDPPDSSNTSENSTDGNSKEKKDVNAGKRDVPNRAEPNSVVEGKRRTREYDAEGKPKRDYDKPHQGDETDHVHEWENGVREHPGRPYSPLPTPSPN